MICQKMPGDLPCIFDLLDIKSYKKVLTLNAYRVTIKPHQTNE